jgi:hypothetical protein
MSGITMATQTKLTNISTASDEEETASIEVTLEEQLLDLGIKSQAVSTLTDQYSDLSALLSDSDHKLLKHEQVGNKAVEAVRQGLDSSVSGDYTITKSGEKYSLGEWTEKADPQKDIQTGEEILSNLKSQFDDAATLLERVWDWAEDYSRAETVADELITAAYDLTEEEVKTATLTITSGGDLEDSEDVVNREVVLKARALMAFCTLTDYRSVRKQAEATAEAESKEQQAKETLSNREEKIAESFIKSPTYDVGGWERVGTGLNDQAVPQYMAAYQGVYNSRPSVIVLFKEGSFVEVNGYRLMDWLESGGKPLEASQSFSVDVSADNRLEAALKMKQWLENNPPEDQVDENQITYNGWYLIEEDTSNKYTKYEHPTEAAEIIAEGDEVVLNADGQTQTEEADTHHQAREELYSYIYTHPVDDSDTGIKTPDPDGLITNSQIPVADHPATASINANGMVLESDAEGWSGFPHPESITSKLEEDKARGEATSTDVEEAIDELTDDPEISEFLVLDSQEVYEYLETLQKTSDLHLENFYRRQLIVDTLSGNTTLATYDKKWIVKFEVRRRLEHRDHEEWGQCVVHKLDDSNSGLPSEN